MTPLFRPAYLSDDPDKRLKAVASLKDQSVLARLACNDSSPRVRIAAVDKITDQDLLVDVALNGSGVDARIAAVEKIVSQRKLAEIIKLRKNYQLMAACFTKITDKSILGAIANDPQYNISARRIAIENYADEAYLSELTPQSSGQERLRNPEEIAALVSKYGGVQLVRALGKFRGSKGAVSALGEIMRLGGEASPLAIEYLAQALNHASDEVRSCAEKQLKTISTGEQVAELIRLMDKTALHEKILSIIKQIDHSSARQFVRSRETPDN